MSKQLPESPNLDHLRKQAKDLLKAARADDPNSVAQMAAISPPPYSLSQAQLATARDYGFESWPKLVAHVEEIRAREGISPEVAKTFAQTAIGDRIEKLRRLLDLYPTIADHDPICALLCGNEAHVKKWITPETAVNTIGDLGLRPIEYVCYSRVHKIRPEAYNGILNCARLLLDNGADPNTEHEEDGAKLAVLYGATGESQHLDLTRLLLERGANPNDSESAYHTPQRYRPDICEVLLEFGCDFSRRDAFWGNTPLYFISGHRPTDDAGPLAMQGFRWLLEHGADPNIACGQNAETPLHSICLRGWGREIVELLLKHGADPNIKRHDDRTAYALAKVIGNEEAAKTLEEHGADTTLSEEEAIAAKIAVGQTAKLPPNHLLASTFFVRLAEVGNAKGVRAMMESGIDPNSKDNGGATALHYAGYCGLREVAETLLEGGASLTIEEPQYKADPLGWALHGITYGRSPKGDYIGVIRAMLARGGDPNRVIEAMENEDAPEDLREALVEYVSMK